MVQCACVLETSLIVVCAVHLLLLLLSYIFRVSVEIISILLYKTFICCDTHSHGIMCVIRRVIQKLDTATARRKNGTTQTFVEKERGKKG